MEARERKRTAPNAGNHHQAPLRQMVRPAEFNAAHFYFTRITLIRINIGRREAHTYKKQGTQRKENTQTQFLFPPSHLRLLSLFPSSLLREAAVCAKAPELSAAVSFGLDNLDPIFVRKWLFYLA